MRRVFYIQHGVLDGQVLPHATTSGGERKPQIVAVDALIDLNGTERHPARSRSRPTASSPSRIASSSAPDTCARSTCRVRNPLLAICAWAKGAASSGASIHNNLRSVFIA